MQFHDFHDQGALCILCERCGREFIDTEEAVHHVFEIHCFEEQVASAELSVEALRMYLNPSPVIEVTDAST
jgi:hypothetical protein